MTSAKKFIVSILHQRMEALLLTPGGPMPFGNSKNRKLTRPSDRSSTSRKKTGTHQHCVHSQVCPFSFRIQALSMCLCTTVTRARMRRIGLQTAHHCCQMTTPMLLPRACTLLPWQVCGISFKLHFNLHNNDSPIQGGDWFGATRHPAVY